ncbi:MAG: hypothetical protein IPJ65_29945 [Archangiaceae bacterium]|nr:hypothetical protein [Archangiaceae bacterium]
MPPKVTDGGPHMKPPIGEKDAGEIVPPWMRQTDAGYLYLDKYAGEPCPTEAYGDFNRDGGPGEYTVTWGICVALRTLEGSALLDGKPVVGSSEIQLQAANYGSQIIRNIETGGHYDIKVMRTRYDLLKYHPEGIWPNHKGFAELGFIDMAKDQHKDLAVTSHRVRGGAFFGGLPFNSVQYPPDVYLRAAGIPPDQHSSSTSVGGTYELALMDGQMALLLNSPPTALQGTELIDYPLTWSFTLDQPQGFDINIPGSELEGNITIDGQPLPDRMAGDDFELDFTPSGQAVVAVTHHEGGLAGFHSQLPKGKYAVSLSFDSIPDKHLPAQLWNKTVSQTIDLNGNATLSKNFNTIPIEGGITIDGKSPLVNPGYNWVLYMYAYASSTESWFFTYYKVPLDSGSFNLRAFPGTYYVAIQLGDQLSPDLVDGFYRISTKKEMYTATSLPIEIETALFSGHLLIDGQPPPVGMEAGTITLRQSDESYTRRVFTGEDGAFQLRVPKGAYEVFFTINRDTYPQYASGRERLVGRLELFTDQATDLIYDTVPVAGPLRVDGKMVDDRLGGDDVQVLMTRRQDKTSWVWGFPGGTPNFYMRVPQGLYDMSFGILQDAMPNTAWGTAPLGYSVPAFSPYLPPPPAR